MLLGKPDPGSTLTMKSFSAESLQQPLEIASVNLLGSDEPIEWKMNESGLELLIPEVSMDTMAVVFAIATI